jgi:NAD-dependent DNA ligase
VKRADLAGKTLVFTGKLAKMKRWHAESIARDLGAHVHDCRSGREPPTDFVLVLGSVFPGGELTLALKRGARVISEAEWMAICAERSTL